MAAMNATPVPADYELLLQHNVGSSHGDRKDSSEDDQTNTNTKRFPKTAHFVYTGEMEVTWIEWLAVRGAIINLGATAVKIWLDERLVPEGRMWERISRMEHVTVIRVPLPTTVFGLDIPSPEQQGDVFRLKVLYEEGGIILENDLIPLRSSDEVFKDPKTCSTIMARRLDYDSIPNWLIMSKPGAPFLKRWMLEYKGAHEPDGWQRLSLKTPADLAMDDANITVLDGHSWFYPIASDPNGDAALKKLWFGKSWEHPERSFGTHVWHWNEPTRRTITPYTIKTIDTPLFCSLRPLLSGLTSNRIVAPKQNANCTATSIEDLSREDHRLFSDYRTRYDDTNIKWVDSSGYHHHGWAPMGTTLLEDKDAGMVRVIDGDSWAVLPVPLGWDAREWTFRLDVKIKSEILESEGGFGLFKVRTQGEGEIVIGLLRRDSPLEYMLDVSWRDTPRMQKANGGWTDGGNEERRIAAEALQNLGNAFHELTITYDRRSTGQIRVFLDGILLGSQDTPLLASPDMGQDIWVNAIEFQNLDMGFRGSLRRFTGYADALSAEIIADSGSLPRLTSPSHPASHTLTGFDARRVPPQNSTLLALSLLVIATFWVMFRSRKTLLREIPWYNRGLKRKVRPVNDYRLDP